MDGQWDGLDRLECSRYHGWRCVCIGYWIIRLAVSRMNNMLQYTSKSQNSPLGSPSNMVFNSHSSDFSNSHPLLTFPSCSCDKCLNASPPSLEPQCGLILLHTVGLSTKQCPSLLHEAQSTSLCMSELRTDMFAASQGGRRMRLDVRIYPPLLACG